jgi:hypothetical protein
MPAPAQNIPVYCAHAVQTNGMFIFHKAQAMRSIDIRATQRLEYSPLSLSLNSCCGSCHVLQEPLTSQQLKEKG